MKYIRELGIITIVIIGLFILPIVIAQQQNEYRAFVYSERISPYLYHTDTTAAMVLEVTYVPIYPSATYTLTPGEIVIQVDLSQPTSIPTQVSQAVKQDGAQKGYDVIRVYISSYDMKVV